MTESHIWLAQPDQYEQFLQNWAHEFPELVTLDTIRQCSHDVHAMTITDESVPDTVKRKVLVIVPHGHEPAGTVASLNYMRQLLLGSTLTGTPTTLDRERILRETLITFIPDGNPEGRSRAPERWWDGSKYDNSEFLKFAFGIDADGETRFKRVDRWHTTEESPVRVGLAYERIDETTYVEPNRDWDSSLFRLLFRLTERHAYDLLIDLHQTEFIGQPYNATILLPVLYDELPANVRARVDSTADAINEAWSRLPGVLPRPPHLLEYTGQQRTYFVERWGRFDRAIAHMIIEVQNNTPKTPARLQWALSETAIRAGVDRLLEERPDSKTP